jgi:hypothetical protein
MKTICLAVLNNGQVQDVLVKLPIDTDLDDLKEALNASVDEYFDEMGGDDEG